MLKRANSSRHASGFSLIELMVSLVLGLIVVGAVLALVISIMKSNRQTLQATRLNQELRATLSVIANDLRRARSVSDPLTTAKAIGGNPYRAVSTATAGCVRYAYDGATGGPWHVIRRDAANNRIVLSPATTLAAATCNQAGTTLGSEQVQITALTFTPTTTSTSPPTATHENVVRRFDITITGNLIDGDAELSGISRTMSQSVYIRSIGTGT